MQTLIKRNLDKVFGFRTRSVISKQRVVDNDKPKGVPLKTRLQDTRNRTDRTEGRKEENPPLWQEIFTILSWQLIKQVVSKSREALNSSSTKSICHVL